MAGLALEPYAYPATELEQFIEGLDPAIRELLNTDRMEDLELNGRPYFAFHDLGDGNHLALDRSMRVWSLVHDAKPMAKLLKVDLIELLSDIAESKFDSDAHLDERYRS